MTKKCPEIQFAVSPVFEMLAAMFRVTVPDRIQMEENGDYPGKPAELKQWVEQKRAVLSENQKKELDVFFNYESYLGLTLIRFAWDEKVYMDIDRFIEALKQFPGINLFSYFLHTGYGSETSIKPENLKTIALNIDQSNLPDTEKWKLLYLYVHHQETKKRLIKLLQSFSQLFEKDLNAFMEKQRTALHKVKDFADVQGTEQLLQRVSRKYQMPVDQMNGVVLAPSVFYDDWSFTTSTENFCLVLFGIRQPPYEQPKDFEGRDKLDQAFRVLADEKRIGIIRLLNRSPLYGYELGQKLHLSNSTISHHLSLLSRYGLVMSVRKENRIYYEVREAQIKELMQRMLQSLVKNQD